MEEFTEQEFGLGKKQRRAHNKKQRGVMKHYLQRVSIEDLEEEFFDDDFDDLTEEGSR